MPRKGNSPRPACGWADVILRALTSRKVYKRLVVLLLVVFGAVVLVATIAALVLLIRGDVLASLLLLVRGRE